MRTRFGRLLVGLPLGLVAYLTLAGAACGGGEQTNNDAGMAADTEADSGPIVVESCGANLADSNGGDAGAGGMADAGGANEGPGALPEGFSYAADYEMRFTSFAFKQSSPGTAANLFLSSFFDQSKRFPIVVLMHMKQIRPEDGTLKLRGGAGLKADKSAKCQKECDYQWDPMSPENYYTMELDAETGKLRGTLDELDFVGTTELANGDVEKFVLPLRDLVFKDAYLRPTEDGGEVAIEQGTLEGYVTFEAADKARVKISSGSEGTKISALLNKEDMNYDSDGDGEIDSWCLQANFSARETDIGE